MIEVNHISKTFGSEPVLHGISFSMLPHTTLSVLGKSGCGKTTLLKILAGLLPADQGSFAIAGKEMLSLRPQHRHVVYISQEPLLFPHLTVSENIAFGLQVRKQNNAVIRKTVDRTLEQLMLAPQAHKMPSMLSGGQRQRVAFGRALVVQPQVMLLDEPFGSLDTATRADMQRLYRQVATENKTTSLFVTHDLKEALIMGDGIARMQQGHLHLYASKKDFVDDPATGVQEEMMFWENLKEKDYEKKR